MQTNGLAVIFDMDGVLVDSYQAHFQSWKTAAARYGLTMAEPDFKATFGRTTRDIIRHLWADKFDQSKIAEFDAAKEADYREILQANLPVMAGAEHLIASLHAAGFKLAIGSSGPKENIAVVKHGLKHGEFFNATTNGSEVKHGKPDPEVFLLCAKKIGIEPAQCAVIEDAPAGVEAARRAGMISIGLLGTAPREALKKFAHVVVAQLDELTPTNIAQWISDKPA
ncbi:MAG TPA: HAD family phosphatase [Tepidisphaeraceae bacterium]|nr:HAD family phosphatase [Tepidisphaeraceae bacterium]